MPSIASTAPINMVFLSIFYLSAIYDTSYVTFINDTQAYTTVDID